MKYFLLTVIALSGIPGVIAETRSLPLSEVVKGVARIPDRHPQLELIQSDAGVVWRFTWIGHSLTEPKEILEVLKTHAEVKVGPLPPLILETRIAPSISVHELLPVLKLLEGVGVKYVLFDAFIFEFQELSAEMDR